MDVNARILELLKKHDWSEYQLRVASDLSQSTISNIFARGTVPTVATLEKICVGFGITLSQFFAGDEEAVPLTQEQRDLLEKWGALTPRQKKTLLDLIENMN